MRRGIKLRGGNIARGNIMQGGGDYTIGGGGEYTKGWGGDETINEGGYSEGGI